MTRPELTPYPLAEALAFRPGTCCATMSPGQWDTLLQVAYEQGWILLEIDGDEQPVCAYRRTQPGTRSC